MKCKQCVIGGSLIKWFEDYHRNLLQRIIINGLESKWGEVGAGLPQGSVLGPLLFLHFRKTLHNVLLHCNIRPMADDACLFIKPDNHEETSKLVNEDLDNI